jgi:adenylate cyclase
LAWQTAVMEREGEVDEDKRLKFRIGINLGDVIVEGDDIHGDGVNIAARLESLAEPAGICLSDDAYRQARGKVEAEFEDLGERRLKNVAEPLRVYRIAGSGSRRVRGTPVRVPLTPPEKPSIAVLPFTNMSGEPDQEYFSDGITEDIITELSRFRTLFVIARNSSFAFKGRSENASDIAQKLGVQYIVEGSVRKAGNRVRVTAQLIEAEDGNHVWAERYDRDLEDIFAVQDEVTQAIVSALPGRLDADAVERTQRRSNESLTAYDYLLRGESYLRRGDFSNDDSLALFENASRIDPKSARAHARIAGWHAYSIHSHQKSAEAALKKAREHAERALELDNSDAMVQAVAAMVFIHLGEYALTEAHIERAMALNPNDVEVLYRRAMTAIYHGDPHAGLDWMKKAMRLNPYYPEYWIEILFDGYYMANNYAAAVDVFRQWRCPPIHMFAEFAAALAQMGDVEGTARAVETCERRGFKEHDIAGFIGRHTRMCKLQADRDHWLDGYRKAGFSV